MIGANLNLDVVAGVFVYGTLKRGQCREKCWPFPPQSVSSAWTLGNLYNGADYPALVPGNDRVVGELWYYQTEVLPNVLEVLDQIEQTGQPGLPDLYRRVIVDVFAGDTNEPTKAYVYHYAMDLRRDGFERMKCREGSFVTWH